MEKKKKTVLQDITNCPKQATSDEKPSKCQLKEPTKQVELFSSEEEEESDDEEDDFNKSFDEYASCSVLYRDIQLDVSSPKAKKIHHISNMNTICRDLYTKPAAAAGVKTNSKPVQIDSIRLVTEYVTEIYDYLRVLETKRKLLATSKQPHINDQMRAILVDWLIEVHQQLKLHPETLHLTVNYLDHFLSKQVVSRSNLQLVGVVALLLASKFEEVYPTEICDLVYITDATYSKEQILDYEQRILLALEFNLTFPSIFQFLSRFLRVSLADLQTQQLANYYSQCILLDKEILLLYLPSIIAAACIYVARASTNLEPFWSSKLEKYTDYSLKDVEKCALNIVVVLENINNSSLMAVSKKFESRKYGNVSNISLPVAQDLL